MHQNVWGAKIGRVELDEMNVQDTSLLIQNAENYFIAAQLTLVADDEDLPLPDKNPDGTNLPPEDQELEDVVWNVPRVQFADETEIEMDEMGDSRC